MEFFLFWIACIVISLAYGFACIDFVSPSRYSDEMPDEVRWVLFSLLGPIALISTMLYFFFQKQKQLRDERDELAEVKRQAFLEAQRFELAQQAKRKINAFKELDG